MTRTALAAPDDDPDDLNHVAFIHGRSKTLDLYVSDIDFMGTTECKRCHPSANRRWYIPVSPQRMAGLAVFIAGRKRADLGEEWRTHLSGETGAGLPESRQLRDAGGFLCAAIRYRLQDVANFAWRPADAVLASRELSNLIVFLATLAIVTFFIRQGGPDELADNLEGVAVVWGTAFGLIRVGRQWRDVKPPKRKPRTDRQ